ncbi:MAG: hypothetical protein RMA76_25275 [Deltaproteobacteria bacterium]
MRSALLLVPLLALACDGSRRDIGAGGGNNGVFRPNRDAGATDAAARDAGPFDPNRDAGPRPDAGALDAGIRDAGFHDAGFHDAGFHDAGFRDAGPPAATVGLTFDGCAADFSGEIVVSYNGSIAVGSVRQSNLTSSLQFDLNGAQTMVLSSQHRIETGQVVNLVILPTTWTNLSTDSDVITGNAPDPIGGTLVVREYVPSAGRIDVDFVQVTLANTTTGGVCRINGNLRATRLSP